MVDTLTESWARLRLVRIGGEIGRNKVSEMTEAI